MTDDVILNVSAVIDPSVPAAQAALDETMRKAKEARRELMSAINTAFMSFQYMMSAVRIGLRAVGQTLDPVQNATLTMIQSTVSAAIALAGLYTATGVLAGVGMGIALLAAEISFIQSARVVDAYMQSQERIDAVERQITRLGNTGFVGVIDIG
jgi:hypothetical protein